MFFNNVMIMGKQMFNGHRWKVPGSMDTHIKLYYFQGYGRASALSMMLEMGGADWEYCGVSFQDWPGMKASMVGNSMPNMEFDDGVRIGESMDIAQLIAEKYDFQPDDYSLLPRMFMLAGKFQKTYLDDFTGFALE